MKTTRTDHLAVKGRPSATVQVGWQICRFANGSCTCNSRNHCPCLSVQITARAVIEAAKEELAETCVPRATGAAKNQDGAQNGNPEHGGMTA